MAADWRVRQLELIPYLRGQSFVRKMYKARCSNWDQEHCEVCWTRIAEPAIGAGILHEGYAVTEDYEKGTDYHWVCADCFEFGKVEMGWIDLTQTPR